MSAPARVLPATLEQQRAFQRAAAGLPPGGADPLPGFTFASVWAGYEPPQYVVKHFLVAAAVTVIFGRSGHLKSQVSIELSMAAATGRLFHGVRTNRCGVLYVAGEGHGGIKKRLRAWAKQHGLDESSDQPAVFVTSQGANLYANPDQLRATVLEAEKVLDVSIGVVVIDTLAANFGPGDENHATDMSVAIASARDAAPGAAVLLVHHTGHGGERERGSYALIGSADYRIMCEYTEAARSLEVRWLKAKDDDPPAPMYFMPKPVNLDWRDQDGEELRSIVLERLEQSEIDSEMQKRPIERDPRSGLGGNQEVAYKILQRQYREFRANLERQNRDPNEAAALLSAFRTELRKKFPDNRIREVINGLTARGLVRVEGLHIYLT